MNGKPIGNKPIYVPLAQGRELHRAQLEAHHSQQSSDQNQHILRGGSTSGTMGLFSGVLPMYMQYPVTNGSLEPADSIMHQMLGTPVCSAPRSGYPLIQP